MFIKLFLVLFLSMIDYIFPLEIIKETAFKAPLPIQNEIKALLQSEVAKF